MLNLQSLDKSTQLYLQCIELFQGARSDKQPIFTHQAGAFAHILSDGNDRMVCIAVTQRNTLALINPPLLSSGLLIQSHIHSVFFFNPNKWTVQTTERQREWER